VPLIGIAIGFLSVRVARVGPLSGSGADDVAVKAYQVLRPPDRGELWALTVLQFLTLLIWAHISGSGVGFFGKRSQWLVIFESGGQHGS
jgi:hypothetical protein